MKKLKEYRARCILCNHAGKHGEDVCDWEVKAKDYWRKVSKYRSIFVSGENIVRNKLERHYEEEHLDIILEVWMNNQSSDSIEEIQEVSSHSSHS